MERGHEIFIYPPDTFLKPILIVSRIGKETALRWVSALNSGHVLNSGFEYFENSRAAVAQKNISVWKIIGDDNVYDEIVNRLKNGEEQGWSEYLQIYNEHCPNEVREER